MEFQDFLTKIESQILTPIIELIALAAFILFVWGVVDFIRNGSDAAKRKEGQVRMFWGIVGLVILFGATAIVNVLKHIVGST